MTVTSYTVLYFTLRVLVVSIIIVLERGPKINTTTEWSNQNALLPFKKHNIYIYKPNSEPNYYKNQICYLEMNATSISHTKLSDVLINLNYPQFVSDEHFMDARTIFIVILLYHFSQPPANYCKGAGSATHIRD